VTTGLCLTALLASWTWAVGAPAGDRRLAELRADHERRLAELRKDYDRTRQSFDVVRGFVPPFDPIEAERLLKGAADASQMAGLEIKVPADATRPLENGVPLTRHRFDVSGRDRYDTVAQFMGRLSYHRRIIELESLRLVAEADRQVRFAARLAFLSYVEKAATETPAPRTTLDEPQRTLVEESDAMDMVLREESRRLEHKLRAEREPLRTLQSVIGVMGNAVKPSGPFDVLATLAVELRPHVPALTEVRFDGVLVLEGVLVGAAEPAALEPALAKARLEVVSLHAVPLGGCPGFSVSARLKPYDPYDPLLPHSGPVLFEQRSCR
jgi:hypothetical protein